MGQEGFIKFFILRFSQLLVSKPCMLVNCLKQGSYIAITKKIILEWSFLILNTIEKYSMLMNIWQFHLSSWQRMGLMWAIPVFVTQDYFDEAFLQLHKLNLTYCLNFFPVTCILLSVCMFDQNHMYPSFISPLEMFQGICNIEGLKGETLKHWITGGT